MNFRRRLRGWHLYRLPDPADNNPEYIRTTGINFWHTMMFCCEGGTLNRTQQHPYRFLAGSIAEIIAPIVCPFELSGIKTRLARGRWKKINLPTSVRLPLRYQSTCLPFFSHGLPECRAVLAAARRVGRAGVPNLARPDAKTGGVLCDKLSARWCTHFKGYSCERLRCYLASPKA